MSEPPRRDLAPRPDHGEGPHGHSHGHGGHALYDPRYGHGGHHLPVAYGGHAYAEPHVHHDGGMAWTEYWRILLKHRFTIASIFAVAIALGVVATLLTKPAYTAQTTLQIDREAARVVTVEDVAPRENLGQAEEFFRTQYGLLKSRSLSLKVVDALGLARTYDFYTSLTGKGADSDAGEAFMRKSLNARREMVARTLRTEMGVRPIVGSRLVEVSYESPDPALSAKVANAFADAFIASNLERKFDSSAYARDFLEKRLAQVKAKLEESERQLVAYAASQQIINVNEPTGQSSQPMGQGQSLEGSDLTSINAALSVATTERIRAEQRWRQAQGASIMSLPEVLANPTIQEISKQRAALMAQYQDKLKIYKPDYPAVLQLKAQIDENGDQIEAEAENIRNSLKNQYDVALSQERSLLNQVNRLKGDVMNLKNRSIQYNILQREVETNRSLYDGLLQRYKEIGVAGGITANNISIVDRAEVPRRPSKPNPVLNIALAALLGIGLGIGSAFLLEALDESIFTPEDVETKLGIPLLGTIPVLARGVLPQDALADVRSPFSEAYYSVRTALQFSTEHGAPSSLFITSATPGEGKTTTSLALAQSFARTGMQVLLIDADLRNPSLHHALYVENIMGLSNLLAGAASFHDVVQTTETPNLAFMACGPLPPNPAELLASGRLREIMAVAREAFDLVMFDGPPIMGFADAPILASTVGGTIVIIEAGTARRGHVKAALKRLRTTNSRLIGAVLAKFNAKRAAYGGDYHYSYAYQYSYGQLPSRETVDS